MLPRSKRDRIEEWLGEYRAPAPGACVLARAAGGRAGARQAFGMADLERRRIARGPGATNYRLASVTKQFTAAAVLMLMEEGALTLDAPVRDWLPSLPEPAVGATLRQLLTHTSGIIDYEDLVPPAKDYSTARCRRAAGCSKWSRAPTSTPGSDYRYSNGGYALLALIIEIVSGMSFATFLRKRIFAPLGMSGTVAYRQGISTVSDRAYGYSWAAGGWKHTDQSLTSAVLGDGGVYSSIDDLAKWDAALYKGRLLRPESLRLAFAPATATDEPGTRYGFGWRITGETVWHSGGSIGFRKRPRALAGAAAHGGPVDQPG